VGSQQDSKVVRGKRSVLAAAAIAVLMVVVGVPRLHADDDRAHCRHETEKAEAKLDRAIADHGKHSHEAVERMEDLRKQRESCYEHIHEWWDGKDQSWHHDDDFGKDLHDHGDHGPDSK
jgi:hypothetical protein